MSTISQSLPATNWWAEPTQRMNDYRRYFVHGGTFFFTVVTKNRYPMFVDARACRLLGDVMRECKEHWFFEVTAIVLMPEHWHAIWTLPPGDAHYPRRLGWIKKKFTQRWLESGGSQQPVSRSRHDRNERGVWQPRYWEHTILDENDFERHFDYIHYNPVKHGHVQCPCAWSASSLHRWVRKGVYESNWGCQSSGELRFDDIEETAME